MQAEKVTVVIPTADRPETLPRAVASVLAQTVRPARVLVADNGVDTAVLEPSWADSVDRVSVGRRVGAARARNIGAGHARTEWIAFLDDDDYWLPDYLERMLDRLAVTADADAVVGRLMRAPDEAEGGAVETYKCLAENPAAMRAVYYRNPGFGGTNLLIRRDRFLAAGGFAETMSSSEDRDLAARLLQQGALIIVAADARAVVCAHPGERAHHAQVRGNMQFLLRHWRAMCWHERLRASRTLLRRFLRGAPE